MFSQSKTPIELYQERAQRCNTERRQCSMCDGSEWVALLSGEIVPWRFVSIEDRPYTRKFFCSECIERNKNIMCGKYDNK